MNPKVRRTIFGRTDMFPFHQRQMGEKLYCKTVFQFSNPLVALQFQGVRLNRASRIWLFPVWPICYPIFEAFAARYFVRARASIA